MTPVADPGAVDDATLDALQRAAFGYFLKNAHPRTGLVADHSREGAPASIAVVGLALSVYAAGVERGWIERGDAVARCLATLRFFSGDGSSNGAASGHRGFWFHFLDMETGARVWESELSIIDSALLVAGMLTAATYFDAEDASERELRRLADAIYRNVDWHWAQDGGQILRHGWKPEGGFLNYGWGGYSEALLVYVLGLGAPEHGLTNTCLKAWALTYQWEDIYDQQFLYAGPLFIHHFSHAWIDFRGIRDAFMREKECDYFENSRRATYVQREYAIRNPLGFAGYGEHGWGLSAGDGPGGPSRTMDGRTQNFLGYAARGVPYGPDDGTISGPSVLCSLPFAPELVWPLVRRWADEDGPEQRRLLASGFNDSLHRPDDSPRWISTGEFGLDQGMIVMMIENFRSGLFWKLCRRSPYLVAGLGRAGFTGGWL